MTVIHIGQCLDSSKPHFADPSPVLFKFLPSVSASHKATFIEKLKTLGNLPCVVDKKLWVGSPSITTPIEKSQGYQIALVSFHQSRHALEEYQASSEHKSVTEEYLWPFKEDVVRFDFEVEGDGEGLARAFVGERA